MLFLGWGYICFSVYYGAVDHFRFEFQVGNNYRLANKLKRDFVKEQHFFIILKIIKPGTE